MLDRLRMLAVRTKSLSEVVDSLPEPYGAGRPMPPGADLINAQGDGLSGAQTHDAHPELAPMDEYLPAARNSAEE